MTKTWTVEITSWPKMIKAQDPEVAFQVEKLRSKGCIQVNYERIDDFSCKLVGYLPND
jgi:hypothetical protein